MLEKQEISIQSSDSGDVSSIVSIIQHNRTLKKLIIHADKIEPTSLKNLLIALKDNDTLLEIHLVSTDPLDLNKCKKELFKLIRSNLYLKKLDLQCAEFDDLQGLNNALATNLTLIDSPLFDLTPELQEFKRRNQCIVDCVDLLRKFCKTRLLNMAEIFQKIIALNMVMPLIPERDKDFVDEIHRLLSALAFVALGREAPSFAIDKLKTPFNNPKLQEIANLAKEQLGTDEVGAINKRDLLGISGLGIFGNKNKENLQRVVKREKFEEFDAWKMELDMLEICDFNKMVEETNQLIDEALFLPPMT